jgi:indole-3-glycerol phosphate synthase
MEDRLTKLVDNAFRLVSSGHYSLGISSPGPSLVRSLCSSEKFPVIAEVKLASPSAGQISRHRPEELVDSYRKAGAAALSVLTEPNHFKGSLANLTNARRASLPLLMKDIVVAEQQIDAGASMGASAVLLIQEVFSGPLRNDERDRLIEHAHSLGLEVVLEAGREEELIKVLDSKADIVGINQRDLRAFRTDPATGLALLPLTSGDPRPVVVMSGIALPEQVIALRDAGAAAVLVGSSLSSSSDPERVLRSMVVPR